MTDDDGLDRTPEELCDLAGLVHVDPSGPGWRRRVQGSGFSYRDVRGAAISGARRRALESLAIPPAWSDVWICPRADGHLLAMGRDDAGRLQRIYHPDFRAAAEQAKYDRMGPFGAHLEKLRRRVVDDMDDDDPRRRTTAAVVRLLDRGLVRVGGHEPQDPDDAMGATTMTGSCVTVDAGRGTIELAFTAKGGIDRAVRIDDEVRLAEILAAGVGLDAETAFAYRDTASDGGIRTVSATDVNAYLREVTGRRFTAKDFRTWGGTATVAGALARVGAPESAEAHHRALLAAVDVAAERLGNTRDVARASYVAPAITEAHRDATLETVWRRTRTGRWADRAERTTMRVLRRS